MIETGGNSKKLVGGLKNLLNWPVFLENYRGQNFVGLCKEGATKRVDEQNFQSFIEISDTGRYLKFYVL